MRRILRILLWSILALSPSIANAQARQILYFTASGSGASINPNGASLNYQLFWTITGGTVSACTITADSSTNNSSWSTGGVITSQSCTANGSSAVVLATPTYARMTVTMTVGTGTPTVRAVLNGVVPTSGGSVTGVTGTAPVVSSGGAAPAISCPTCAIGPGTSVATHVATFSGTDGKTLADGGALASGTVTGTGTSNTVVKWTSTSATGNSSMTDDGTNPVASPNGVNVGTTGGYYIQVANDTVTGTTVSSTACLTATKKAIVCPSASSVSNVPLGFVFAGAGTSGNATICNLGSCTVKFDNQTVVGDYAINSPTVAGQLHDNGATLVSGQSNYFVSSANAGANTTGTVRMFIADDFISSSGTGAGFPFGGDGSDGTVTFDGTTTVLGLVPSSSTYTLTRDIFLVAGTVNSGVTIKTANFGIFVQGTLTDNGTIQNDGTAGGSGATSASSAGGNAANSGQNGSSGTNGRYPAGASLQATINTGTGGAGTATVGNQSAPSAGIASASACISGGAAGITGATGGQGGTGTGGAGGATKTGTAGGTITANANGRSIEIAFTPANHTITGAAISWTLCSSYNGGPGNAAGGSGGGGDGTNFGGGGGGAGAQGGIGGDIGIFAKTITIGATGLISAKGGAGGNGGAGRTMTVGNVGGGGGGGGGNGGSGGYMWLVYQTLTNSGTLSVAGGALGTGGAAGSPFGTGTNNAAAGSNGSAGPSGIIVQLPVK